MVEPPAPSPFEGLGATVELSGDVRFRLFSSRATRVALLLFAEPFNADPVLERVLEREPGSDIWSVRVTLAELEAQGLKLPLHYGYRVWGPNWPYEEAWKPGSEVGFKKDVDADGNRFNPNKLLLDPYARELSHDPTRPDQHDASIYLSGHTHRKVDTAKLAPKGIVLPPMLSDLGPKPQRPLKDDIIYEVHLRGLTRGDLEISPAECRGTYKAAAAKAEHLRSLGVTAIELLPVQETWNDNNDVAVGTDGDNYWGYSTEAFFAPDRRYACDKSPGGPTREFREMVKAFHDAGLKVFIDVVYNHSGEGNPDSSGEVAALRSFRGLDNAAYYQLDESKRGYRNDNGVSANMNVTHEAMRRLVLDASKYWAHEMGVDGFRFDLAALLGNVCTGDCFLFDPTLPDGIPQRTVRELPARPETGGAGVDLIAEPWGVTPGTFQFGKFPRGWSEWNGDFRDTVRRDLNALGLQGVSPRTLLHRMTGSPDLMPTTKKPYSNINYVVSHDGFTLWDLYTCNEKQNEQPWPFGPSQGGENHNLSWDHGGDAVRQRQAARTSLALLALSAGVPMLTGGDEMLRTQYCNNNPYNLDSEKNWLQWDFALAQRHFLDFSRRLFQFRHAHAALRPLDRYRDADANGNGLKALTVLTPGGTEADAGYLDDWNQQFLGLRYDGTELGDSASSLYVGYNGNDTALTATLPSPSPGKRWYRVADTAAWFETKSNIVVPGQEEILDGRTYLLHPRSLLLAIER